MKTSKPIYAYISNAVCLLLLLVLIGTQFMPFWLCEDCKTHPDEAKQVSIAEYTWFPKKHSPITKGMTAVYQSVYGENLIDEQGKPYKFQANDTVIPCIVMFAAAIITICMLVKNPANPWLPLFPFAAGVTGAVGYLSILALQIGPNWQLHLVASGVLAAASAAVLAINIIKMVKKARPAKEEAPKE